MVAIIPEFNRFNLLSQWVWCVNIKCSLLHIFPGFLPEHTITQSACWINAKTSHNVAQNKLRCVHWDVGVVENGEKIVYRNAFV